MDLSNLPRLLRIPKDAGKPKRYFRDLAPIRNGVVVASHRFVSVFENHKTDKTQLINVEIRDFAGERHLSDDYFIINIADVADCFDPEASVAASGVRFFRQRPDGRYRPKYGSVPDVVLRRDAIPDVDVWMAPNYRMVPFFSDRLKRAIQAMDPPLKPRLVFKRCRLA